MKVRAAAVQIGPVDGDVEATIAKCVYWLDRAAEQQVQLAVLPELVIPGVAGLIGLAGAPDRTSAQRELISSVPQVGGEWIEQIADRARMHGMTVVVGTLATENEALVNASVLISDGGEIIAVHRKAHLTPEVEAPYVRAGDRLDVHDTAVGRLGHPICADLSLPETARVLAIKGAQIICGSLGFFYEPGAGAADRRWMRQMYLHSHSSPSRAVDNGVFLITSNLTGRSGGVEFFGRSRIIDPNGDVLAEGEEGIGVEQLVVADLDFQNANRLPFSLIGRRRPELYSEILSENRAGSVNWRTLS